MTWYRNGERHRDGGPAYITPEGHQEWYQNGRRHRDDGPAITWPNGKEAWYQDGFPVEQPRDESFTSRLRQNVRRLTSPGTQ